MKHKQLKFERGFDVLMRDRHAQAAQMTLPPGQSEGGADNSHRGADQWLYVVGGTGVAVVKGRKIKLREGTLLLIERGETHEIRNTGRKPLRTINLYVPPAYSSDGNELPRGRSA